MYKFSWIVAATLSVALATGCDRAENKAKSKSAITLQSEDGSYYNEFVGLRATLPEDWEAMTSEQMGDFLGNATDVMYNEDQELEKRAAQASLNRSVNVFAFYDVLPGSATTALPASVLTLAESLAGAPGIKRGKDINFHTNNALIVQEHTDFECDLDAPARTVGSVEFDAMTCTGTRNGRLISSQTYYAFVDGDWGLTIVATEPAGSTFPEINEILDSIEYTPRNR